MEPISINMQTQTEYISIYSKGKGDYSPAKNEAIVELVPVNTLKIKQFEQRIVSFLVTYCIIRCFFVLENNKGEEL